MITNMSAETQDCSSQKDHHGHGAKHPQIEILTSGTTTISDQSQDATNFIFAGTSFENAPTLEFVGGLSYTGNYIVNTLLAGNGNVHLGYNTGLTVTNGVDVLGGELYIYDAYSSTTLDGNSLIDANGSLNDYGGGAYGGGDVLLNGNITVGSLGTNSLVLPFVGGNGTILQTGSKDTTSINGVGSGVHLEIRAGQLGVGGSVGYMDGTIGPVNGKGPSLGPSASFTLVTVAFYVSDVKSATYDTSTGLLSFMNARGQALYNPLHFSGDASGLNLSTAGGIITITDHPGSTSPIPITFT